MRQLVAGVYIILIINNRRVSTASLLIFHHGAWEKRTSILGVTIGHDQEDVLGKIPRSILHALQLSQIIFTLKCKSGYNLVDFLTNVHMNVCEKILSTFNGLVNAIRK